MIDFPFVGLITLAPFDRAQVASFLSTLEEFGFQVVVFFSPDIEREIVELMSEKAHNMSNTFIVIDGTSESAFSSISIKELHWVSENSIVLFRSGESQPPFIDISPYPLTDYNSDLPTLKRLIEAGYESLEKKTISEFEGIEKIEDLVSFLENDIGIGPSISGIDLTLNFYNEAENTGKGMNLGFSTPRYKEALNEFLSSQSSMSFSNKDFSTYDFISCNTVEIDTKTRTETEEEIPYNNEKNNESSSPIHHFNAWNKVLQVHDVGRTSIWVNRNFPFNSISINVSTFIVFNHFLRHRDIERVLGVVFSHLFRLGIDFAVKVMQKRNDALIAKIVEERIRREISEENQAIALAHSHTVFNQDPLFFLREAINMIDSGQLTPKKIVQVENDLKDAERITSLVFALMQSAFRSKRAKVLQGKTVTEMIEWLWSLSLSFEKELELELAFHHNIDVLIEPAQSEHAFTVLWNLMNNAKVLADKEKGHWKVSTSNQSQFLFITISNTGEIDEKARKKLLSTPHKNLSDGLDFVAYSIQKLNWEIDEVFKNDGWTTVSIKIPAL